jgi:hypothetical protein
MLRALIRWPALFARSETHTATEPTPPATDRSARWFVSAVWVAMLALLVVFVAKTATRIPYIDEYFNTHLLAEPFSSPSLYWAQHNEHRIPLPRILFVTAVRLAGYDFRAPPVMNALILAAVAVVLTRAVARVRGRFAYTDAFLPLLVMNLGQHDNLYWGFQIQFISSSALALLMLAVVIHPRFADSPRRIALAGVITLLVPLCGANGVALSPAFSCLLLAVAGRNLWSGGPVTRWPGVIALGFGLAGMAMIPLYFYGLRSCGHHETTRAWDVIAVNAANFPGIGFGSVAFLAHGLNPSGLSEFGLGMLVLLAVTGVLLAVYAWRPERRMTAVALTCVIGAVLSLGLGLAYGRGAMGSVLACNRYSTLAMPLVAAVYVAWAVLPVSRWGRIVPIVLLLVGFASLWPNVRQAFAIAAVFRSHQGEVEYAIRTGVPVTFIVDRHHIPAEREVYVAYYLALRRLGVVPFRDLVLDPPMDDTPIPVIATQSEGMSESGGFYTVTGAKEDKGHIVLALPRRQFVYGFRLTYQSHPSSQGDRVLSVLTWEPGGTFTPRPGYGMIGPLTTTSDGPVTAHIFVDRETDVLRIDLLHEGARVRIHGLCILTRRD